MLHLKHMHGLCMYVHRLRALTFTCLISAAFMNERKKTEYQMIKAGNSFTKHSCTQLNTSTRTHTHSTQFHLEDYKLSLLDIFSCVDIFVKSAPAQFNLNLFFLLPFFRSTVLTFIQRFFSHVFVCTHTSVRLFCRLFV